MNADQVRAGYRRAMEQAGTSVHVRRYAGTGAARPFFQAEDVAALAREYRAADLVGAIREGDQEVIVLDEDLVAAQFAVPVRHGDKVVLRGKELNVEAADGNSRRLGHDLVAWVLRVRG
jgi:hypothetical protein